MGVRRGRPRPSSRDEIFDLISGIQRQTWRKRSTKPLINCYPIRGIIQGQERRVQYMACSKMCCTCSEHVQLNLCECTKFSISYVDKEVANSILAMLTDGRDVRPVPAGFRHGYSVRRTGALSTKPFSLWILF